MTRDAAAHVVLYVNGQIARGARSAGAEPPTTPPGPFQLDDTIPVADALGAKVAFFIDDAVTGSEAGAGWVRRIRIYDVALTAAQVLAQ